MRETPETEILDLKWAGTAIHTRLSRGYVPQPSWQTIFSRYTRPSHPDKQLPPEVRAPRRPDKLVSREKKCITSNQTCKFLEKHMPQPSRLYFSGETRAPATQTKRMVDRAPLTSDLFAGVFLCKRRNQLRFPPTPHGEDPDSFRPGLLGHKSSTRGPHPPQSIK